tara:strand:+ start:6335 stop:7276 length:942 start_codon:yes stop_codon:yes gene_type:complete
MNIREINKPITAKSLNESLAKRFGKKIALEKFTLEQLQDVRNRVRTTLSQVETNESFDTVNSEGYQKNKLFLDVLNAEINERADISETQSAAQKAAFQKMLAKKKGGKPEAKKDAKATAGEKPDFADIDGDGDKKEPMKKAAADKQNESIIKEGAEDQAELVMAAKNMVERLTSWMEDTAEMQTESMLELADAIRDEMSSEQSEAFVNTIKPALEALYGTMETTRQALTQGVGMLTGEGTPPPADMGAEPEGADMDMEPTVDADSVTDEFGAAAPAAGGEAEAGRERRESRMYAKKKMIEASRRLGTILSKKK